MAAWTYGDDKWVDLPGPASWWPKNIDSTGFNFPEKDSQGYMDAWKIVEAEELPTDGSYERILPAHSELWLMPDTSASYKQIQAFHGLQIGF